MEPNPESRRLVVITGAGGVVGREYVRYFSQQPSTICISIARRPAEASSGNIIPMQADLLDTEAVRAIFEKTDLEKVGEVIFVHAVGKFKFEPEGAPQVDIDMDGIDDEVFSTNIETFTNVLSALFHRLDLEREKSERAIAVTLCGLGSISDKHQVKYWNSYTKAKNILRSIIYNLVQERPTQCKGLFVNVSTVDTENENELRPHAEEAEKAYWLKGSEIVTWSLPYLLGEHAGSWKQIDIYKEHPLFKEGYYENLEEIRRRWDTQREGAGEFPPPDFQQEEARVITKEVSGAPFKDPSFKFPR